VVGNEIGGERGKSSGRKRDEKSFPLFWSMTGGREERRSDASSKKRCFVECRQPSSLFFSFSIPLTFSREHISGPSSLPSRKGGQERWTEPLENETEEKEKEARVVRRSPERKK